AVDRELVAAIELEHRAVVLFRDEDVDDARLQRAITHVVGLDETRSALSHIHDILLLLHFLDRNTAQSTARSPTLGHARKLRITSTLGSARTRNANTGRLIALYRPPAGPEGTRAAAARCVCVSC